MSFYPRKITVALLCIFLAACGGGGGSDGTAQNPSGNDAGTNSGTGSTGNAGSGDSSGGNPSSPENSGSGNTGSTPNSPTYAYDTTARFNRPANLQLDNAGNLLVFDSGNQVMRRIAASGEVSTLHNRDPESLMDAAGNTFVVVRNDVEDPSERDNTEIVRISPDGTRKVIARYVDQPGSVSLRSMQLNAQGQLYVLTNYRTEFWIHKMDPDAPLADRSFFGGGAEGLVYHVSTYGFLGGFEVDAQGNLAVTTYDPEGILNGIIYIPVSAQPAEDSSAGTVSYPPNVNGSGFRGMRLGRNGALYIAYAKLDQTDGTDAASSYIASEMRIYKANPDGTLVTVLNGFPDGRISSLVSETRFPIYMDADSSGNVYMSDTLEHAIYKISPSGQISLYAGTPEEAGNSD